MHWLTLRYEEFYNSYGAMTVEIMRRHQARQLQQMLVQEFTEKMQSMLACKEEIRSKWILDSLYEILTMISFANIDEMQSRTVFSEKHDKYLPVDLCPAFAVK